MSIKNFITILFTSFLLCHYSCTTDNDPHITNSGIVNINLNIDNKIIICGNDSILKDSLIPSIDDFSIAMKSFDGNFVGQWTSISQYPKDEAVRTGSYSISATYGDINIEGFEKPFYYGGSEIHVSEGTTSNVEITCALANTMVSIRYSEAFKSFFTEYSAILHSEGGAYIDYLENESRPVYLKPGKIYMLISLTKKNGINSSFQPVEINNALPQHHYFIYVDVKNTDSEEPSLEFTIYTKASPDKININVSDDAMKMDIPQISTEGFSDNIPLNIVEGEIPSSPIIAHISSKSQLKSLTLTTRSKSLISDGFPPEIDLITASDEQRNILETMGLKTLGLSENQNNIQIDFTKLLSNIEASADNPKNEFIIVAKDQYYKTNTPVYLSINTTPININIISTSQSTIGINDACINISTSSAINTDLISVLVTDDNSEWHKITPTKITKIENNKYKIDLNIPSGVLDSNIKILYLNNEKSSSIINRISPKFKIEVDAFANKAIIKVIADDPSMTESITKNISIFVNNYEPAILERNISQGFVAISGLNASTKYQVKATVMEGNPHSTFSNSVSILTETIENVPDGSFESTIQTINSILPCGGKYSQSHMPIYNQQNTSTIIVSEPKKNWATVNSKTFCKSAKLLNTWYMQPSSMITNDAALGNKAMKLTSVAWDTNGEEIPSYAQETDSYVPYNKNIPSISYRAAGKLFLGKYEFDMTSCTEKYSEGITFTSRPSALNGYYKYTPCSSHLSDKGIVLISIINRTDNIETEIACGQMLFSGNSDYTAFTVPLTYNKFGLKATHIKIMFASSLEIGSIEEESAKIITTDNAMTASSTGSTLWIDYLSFSY